MGRGADGKQTVGPRCSFLRIISAGNDTRLDTTHERFAYVCSNYICRFRRCTGFGTVELGPYLVDHRTQVRVGHLLRGRIASEFPETPHPHTLPYLIPPAPPTKRINIRMCMYVYV